MKELIYFAMSIQQSIPRRTEVVKKQSNFLFLITMLCIAFAGTTSLNAQISKEGLKIKLFVDNDKGKSVEYKIDNTTTEVTLCSGVHDSFDRIEISGKKATITVVVRNNIGDIVYMNKGYYLENKATFKPFEGHNMEDGSITILKDDKPIAEFSLRIISCT